jgi:hypothetical protein
VIHFTQCVHKSVDESRQWGDVLWTTVKSRWTGSAIRRRRTAAYTRTPPVNTRSDLRQIRLSTASTRPKTMTKPGFKSERHDILGGAQLWTTVDVSRQWKDGTHLHRTPSLSVRSGNARAKPLQVSGGW